MNEFLSQLLSNFLATISAGILLYLCLEKRIKDEVEKRETVKLLKNLASDLSYNIVSIIKIIEKEKEYITTDRFTLLEYHTKGLNDFYYQKPFTEDREFPYVRLLALIRKFEINNSLIKFIHQGANYKSIFNNKIQFFNDGKSLKDEIVSFLNDTEFFFKQYKIILTEFS